MANETEKLLEAERRGILPPAAQLRLDEARRRGLIPEMLGADDIAPPRPSFGEAFARTAIERFLSNAGATPAVIGNFMIDALSPSADVPIPGPLEAGAAAIKFATGGRVDPLASAEASRAAGAQPIPRIAGTDIMAASETLRRLAEDEATRGRGEGSVFAGGAAPAVAEAFGEAQGSQQRLLAEAQADRPLVSAAGGAAGDVATLLTGRAPIRAPLRQFEARRATLPPSARAPGIMRQLDDIVRSRFARSLERAGLRIGEAGLEGAVLAVLDGGDPVQTAALAAGGQALGTSLIGLETMVAGRGGTFSRSGVARIGATALLVGGAIQVFKEKTPGGRDRILESFEQGAGGVAAIMALGALATLAGGGRTGGRFAEDLPLFADALTAVPRGALISLAKDLSKTDAASVEFERTLSTIVANPDAFGAETMRRFDRAFRNGNLRQEVDRLMRNRDFRQRLDELGQ